MSNEKRQQLHPGQMMPDFELHTADGKPVRLSLFKQRYNLVVIFMDPAGTGISPEYLADMKENEDEFHAENTRVLIVAPDAERSNLSGDFLFDRSGAAYHTVVAADYIKNPGSVVVVVDRFGEIDAIFRQTAGEPLPPGEVLLEEVRFIELQCPE